MKSLYINGVEQFRINGTHAFIGTRWGMRHSTRVNVKKAVTRSYEMLVRANGTRKVNNFLRALEVNKEAKK